MTLTDKKSMRTALLVLACASAHAFHAAGRLGPYAMPRRFVSVAPATIPRSQEGASAHARSVNVFLCNSAAAGDEPASPLGRFKAWFKKWASFDKDQLKTLGVDAFFTYGVVSNINAGFTVALAWSTFSKASGFSPLAAGQWKPFLATYFAIYATLGSILRPFRFALAVTATPLYTRFVKGIRDRLPFRETKPRLNRTLALVFVSMLLNVVGTSAIIFFGISIAGLISGVPPFPPGWSAPWSAA